MKPSRKVSSGIEDLFRSRFENIINLRHELVVLGGPDRVDFLRRDL